MPTFQYTARTKAGEIRTGTIETSSMEAALDNLQQQGLIVVSANEHSGPSLLNMKIPGFGGVSQKDLVIFSRQFATLFEARIPVMESLKTLLKETRKQALKEVIAQILDDVAGGLSISQAMSKHHQVFSLFYINLIRSGEESGKLQEVFAYIADYMERSYYLTSKARNATIYPAFVLTAFLGVIVVLMVVVIPKLVSIFEETGQPVPFYTQAVIGLSVILREYGIFLVIGLIMGAVAFWRWSFTNTGKLFLHTLQLRIPILGNLYRKLYMARMTDNLRTLIVSGIPILRALSITGDVVGNVIYQKAIHRAIESVKEGGSISAAFEKTPEIPPLVTQMIRIGEASGKLDFILGGIAKFYQKDVDSLLENLVTLIEPLLIVFLGAGVGILVASVMVPLYNLVGNI